MRGASWRSTGHVHTFVGQGRLLASPPLKVVGLGASHLRVDLDHRRSGEGRGGNLSDGLPFMAFLLCVLVCLLFGVTLLGSSCIPVPRVSLQCYCLQCYSSRCFSCFNMNLLSWILLFLLRCYSLPILMLLFLFR